MCEEASAREEIQTSDEYDQDNASESGCCSHYAIDCAGGSDSTAQRERVREPTEKKSCDIGPNKGETSRNTGKEKSRHPTGLRDLFLKYEAEEQEE